MPLLRRHFSLVEIVTLATIPLFTIAAVIRRVVTIVIGVVTFHHVNSIEDHPQNLGPSVQEPRTCFLHQMPRGFLTVDHQHNPIDQPGHQERITDRQHWWRIDDHAIELLQKIGSSAPASSVSPQVPLGLVALRHSVKERGSLLLWA